MIDNHRRPAMSPTHVQGHRGTDDVGRHNVITVEIERNKVGESRRKAEK